VTTLQTSLTHACLIFLSIEDIFTRILKL